MQSAQDIADGARDVCAAALKKNHTTHAEVAEEVREYVKKAVEGLLGAIHRTS